MPEPRLALVAAVLVPVAFGFLAPVSLHYPHRVATTGRRAVRVATEARALALTSMAVQNSQPALEMTPRRKQFFRTVSDGLGIGFEGQDISRVEKFVQYCKGELEYKAQAPLHQPSEEYVEGLRARPWWEPAEFEWVSKLEEKSSIVIDEFAAFWNDPLANFAKDSMNMNVMGKGWSGVRLQRLGNWLPENCAKFPNTVNLLKELEIPLAVRGIMFARQVPGSGVSRHSDGRNFILTVHLGVDVPKDCWMRVGEDKKVWKNGKALVLDTSFEHETFNNSRRDRIVLIIDFWHPDLTMAEQEALAFVYDLRNKFESGDIPLEEKESGGLLGAFKRAFQ